MDCLRGMHYNRNLNMIYVGFCGAKLNYGILLMDNK